MQNDTFLSLKLLTNYCSFNCLSKSW